MKFEKDIVIILNQNIIDDLKVCVRNANPNEACGFIFGDINEVQISEGFQYHYIAQKFECFESDRKSPVSFLIENIERLNEVWQNAAQKFNLRLISIFHSHPAGSSPSGVDHYNMEFLDNCGNKAFKNQIWTIMDAQNYDLNAFIYYHEEIRKVTVEINK
ncbi:MAG: Mov34/MPN/PAD-1 family protein [Promethearchaeota archaeon]